MSKRDLNYVYPENEAQGVLEVKTFLDILAGLNLGLLSLIGFISFTKGFIIGIILSLCVILTITIYLTLNVLTEGTVYYRFIVNMILLWFFIFTWVTL